MNEELNEQEMQQLERELRSYGDPYGSPEPDERYFANFRARVMERIAQEPQVVGFGTRISEFFFGSPLRMTLVGGSLIGAILLYFYLQSAPTELPVAQDAPRNELVAPESPALVEPEIANVPKQQKPQQHVTPEHRNRPVPQQIAPEAPVVPQVQASENGSATIADAASEFDKIDDLSLSDESEPVSYDKLSVDELEAVLKTLETEPLTIQ